MTACKREHELVVERTGAEVLLYDLRTDAAHHLDPDAAAVWDACAGECSLAEVADATGLTVEAVESTVGQLAALDLLNLEEGNTRRETLQRSLVAAGALAALPVIKSLSAPDAAQAASLAPAGTPCTSGAQCASTVCAGVCT